MVFYCDGCQKSKIMNSQHESQHQKEIADYNTYLQLKTLKYSNVRIAEHLNYSKKQLGYLISSYHFKNNLEYKLQESKGEYFFSGNFYITASAQEVLTTEEIIEIYQFVQDLAKQHNGIDYLQTFYHIEQDCKLFFIDQLDTSMLESQSYSKEDNYCTLMLSSDY